MGTEVTIVAAGAPAIQREVRRLEAILTRFGDSQVARLNRTDRLEHPAPELVEALSWAVHVATLSGGLVTPLVGRAMEWHGYRESWHADVAWEAPTGTPPAVPPIDMLLVTPDEIVLPPGAAIDLGGTAKSWVVARAAAGHRDVVIDAGGDVLIDSPRPHEVDLPTVTEEWHLTLSPGRWGVATSSVARRAWRGAHHLIDPRTGRPVLSPRAQATAVGRSLELAEVATKLLLMGAPVPAALQVEYAWVVGHDGSLCEHRLEGEAHGADRSFVPAG